MSQIHPQARTTPRVRAEIQASEDSPAELARRYNISEPTAAKWQARDSVEDRSHRPHKLSTTLSPAQEAIVVELRRLLLLPLDDLLVITREFVNAQASRSALDRCLRRHGVNNLRELQAAASGESAQAAPPKRFKDYEPGFVHVDIKYLPQMPDETARRYLYVGIDRATRWVFVRIYADMETTSAVDFVNRLHEAAPMRIDKLLTDNGACFTDRFQRKSRTPSGKHHFDVRCRALGIEHRLCPPRHPQTNGLVERFNGRIAEITAQTRFHSAAELEQTLMNYVKVYNTRIPQRALDHHTPLDALKSWRAKSPDLFKKRPKNLPGLDIYPVQPADPRLPCGQEEGGGCLMPDKAVHPFGRHIQDAKQPAQHDFFLHFGSENHPGHPRLQEFEQKLDVLFPIRWRDLLLPPPEQTQAVKEQA